MLQTAGPGDVCRTLVSDGCHWAHLKHSSTLLTVSQDSIDKIVNSMCFLMKTQDTTVAPIMSVQAKIWLSKKRQETGHHQTLTMKCRQ